MQTDAKIIHCVGKHKADPIGANFFKETSTFPGIIARSDRVVSIGMSQEAGKIRRTSSRDTESLAAERSIVSISLVNDPVKHNDWFLD
jgi:hypothetical protein